MGEHGGIRRGKKMSQGRKGGGEGRGGWNTRPLPHSGCDFFERVGEKHRHKTVFGLCVSDCEG